jgi:hypothetical protein
MERDYFPVSTEQFDCGHIYCVADILVEGFHLMECCYKRIHQFSHHS